MVKLETELKTRKFQSAFQRANLNIVFTANWLNENFNEIFRQFDLSQQQYNVLRILRGQNGNAINLIDIQGRMLQKNSNATRLVEKLRQKGLVERILCEQNRRKVEITITPRGIALLSEIDPFVKKYERKLFKSLTEKEATTLGNLLDKLRESK